MKKVFTLCILLSFFYLTGQSQTDSATWALTSNGNSTVSSFAIAAAGFNRRNADLSFASYVGYSDTGFGATEWKASAFPKDSDYFQYVIAPAGNRSFTVSSIRLTAAASLYPMNYVVRYRVTATDLGSTTPFLAVSTVAGASSYTVVPGAPVAASITGLAINVPPGNVLYIRVYGYASPFLNNVFYNSNVSVAGTVCTLPDAITNIYGPATACAGRLQTYSIDSMTHADSYAWTVPAGWHIINGQGTASIRTVADAGANGSISVVAQNACGTSNSPRTVSIKPVTDSFNTGYVDYRYNKYTDDIYASSTQSPTGAREGFLKFPLLSLPSNAFVSTAVLTLFNDSNVSSKQSFFYHYVIGTQNLDPVTAPATTLFQSIYYSSTLYSSAVWGGEGNLFLPFSSYAINDIRRYRSSGFFSFGLQKVAGSTVYKFSGYTDTAHAPQLSITYTIPAYAKGVTVTALPAVSSITGAASLCQNSTTTYTDETTGGAWSVTDSTGNATISPDGILTGTSAGIVTVNYTITNENGCDSTSTTFVTINALPDALATEIAQPTCSVATGTVTVTSPVDETYSYSIDSVTYQSSNVFSNIAPGNYTVYVKNSSGCLSSSNVVVNTQPASPSEPVIEITQPTCAIATGAITITSPTETGDIYSLDGVNYQTSNLFSEVAPGIYNVYVINSNGCLASAFATVNPQPALPVAFIVYEGSPYCASGVATVTQTGTSGGVYFSTEGLSIDSSTGTINLAASSAGTYTVTYGFSNGPCANTASTTVVINPLPTASIGPIAALACEGNSVQLFIAGTYGASVTYQINGSGLYAATVPAYITSPNTAGTYIYTLTSVTENGCAGKPENSASSITIRPTPDATISGRSFVQAGSSITLTGATGGGTWSVSNCNLSLSCTNTNPVTATGKKAGITRVKYTLPDEYGCTGSDTKVVVVLPDRQCSDYVIANKKGSETEMGASLKSGTTDAINNNREISVLVYPNPVREAKINLQLANLKKGSYLMSLYSAAGQTLYQKKVVVSDENTTQNEVLLLSQPLAQGMYQLRVADNEGTIIKTIKIMAAR